jgi:uncharacterized membrane protein YhaH (DUF805 family)
MAVRNTRQIFYHLILAILVVFFAYTAFHKMLGWEDFADQMRNQPMPLWLSGMLAVIVPTLSIIIAVLLVLRSTRLTGFVMAFALLLCFDFYVTAIILELFPYVPCSCAGISSRLSWGEHLAIDVSLTLLAGAGAQLHRRLLRPSKIYL